MRTVVLLIGILFLTVACSSPTQTAAQSNGSGAAAAATAQPAAAQPAAQLPTPTTDATSGVTGALATAAVAMEVVSATNPITTSDAVTKSAAQPATSAMTTTAAPPDLASIKLKLEPVITGVDQPLFLTTAGDETDRLFVVEKTGRIRIFANGQLVDAPLLDISDKVSLGSEQGLLGLAFAPDYTTSGHFFINYTDTAGDTNIVRYSVSANDRNSADPASAQLVLKLDQPAPNHNGGMLLFGPDGKLWIGTGDGGAANNIFGNARNPNALLGKILRIDVTSHPEQPYTIPQDNPWVTAQWNGQDVRDEIWAIGMRNPWRYSFDRATGDLWIGDVGQNLLEEVDEIPAGTPGGLDFGWSIMEGKSCFQAATCDQQGLVIPVIDYPHGPHCSITGGYVYRGVQIPSWNGVYFYGDYCSGVMWALAPDGAGSWNNLQVLEGGSINLSSFGEDAAGELYVTDLSGGTVYQMTQGE